MRKKINRIPVAPKPTYGKSLLTRATVVIPARIAMALVVTSD